MGSIIVQKNVSSDVFGVTIMPRRPAPMIGTTQSPPSNTVVKIRKTVQHVRILRLSGEFTSVMVERVEGDQEEFEMVSI